MIMTPWVQISTCKTVVMKSVLPHFNNFQSSIPYLPPKTSNRPLHIRASSVNSKANPPSSSDRKSNPLVAVLDITRSIWRQTLQPLSDFGFGRKSIWEDGVRLFVVSRAVLFALTMVWLRAFQLRSQFRKYQAVFEFSQACGICLGTLVRIRRVPVGTVVRVNSPLKSIGAIVEVWICSSFFFMWCGVLDDKVIEIICAIF